MPPESLFSSESSISNSITGNLNSQSANLNSTNGNSDSQSSIDEGYIKFNCSWQQQELNITIPPEIKIWRDRMYELKLIGHYQEFNVGYGNISMLMKEKMLVSGTQTGEIYPIEDQHFTIVDDYSIDRNWVHCVGEIKASSESLTHLAIYQCNRSIQAIIHIHNLSLWSKLLNKLPTTNPEIPYGTPEMAKEIERLFQQTDVEQSQVIVMAGHQEGIISFGKTMSEAGNRILQLLD